MPLPLPLLPDFEDELDELDEELLDELDVDVLDFELLDDVLVVDFEDELLDELVALLWVEPPLVVVVAPSGMRIGTVIGP